jgi:ABC-type amino acid transport substrate-binding protein
MKKVIALVLLFVLTFSLAACGKKEEEPKGDIETIKKAGVIRIGMECDYAPFNWMATEKTDTSEPVQSGGYADGYDVYFSRMVAEALGVKVEVVKLEWEGLTLALEAGTIDLIIAGMSPTPERKVTVDFTDPYYIGEKTIIVRKGSKYANATSLEDFSGALITHQHNNAFGELIDQIPNVTNDDRYSDTPRMIVAVQAGEVDGFVDEVSVGMSVVNANPDLTYVTFAPGKGFVVDESDSVNAIGCRKGSDMVEFINGILAKVSDAEREALMDKARKSQPVIADAE